MVIKIIVFRLIRMQCRHTSSESHPTPGAFIDYQRRGELMPRVVQYNVQVTWQRNMAGRITSMSKRGNRTVKCFEHFIRLSYYPCIISPSIDFSVWLLRGYPKTQPRGHSSANIHRLIHILFCCHMLAPFPIQNRARAHSASAVHPCMIFAPNTGQEGVWSLEYKCLEGEKKGAAQSR